MYRLFITVRKIGKSCNFLSFIKFLFVYAINLELPLFVLYFLFEIVRIWFV